jgi:signal peptidase
VPNSIDHTSPSATANVSRRRLGTAAKASGAVLIACAVVLGASMLVPSLLGYQRYVITGGSMTGTFGRGSIVYDKVVPTSELKVGDVITYTPPPLAQIHHPITHRIAASWRDEHGARFFRTMGDANRTTDPWAFTLHHARQARVSFHLPYLGYAIAALNVRVVRMLVIGLPALLIALAALLSLWRDTGRQVRRGSAYDAREGMAA